MGRIKNAAQKLKEANLAKAREDYYARTPDTVNPTVTPRKANKYVYGAYMLKAGTAQQLLEITGSDAAVQFFGLSALGLKLPKDITDPVLSKPREFHPAMVHAMVGAGTPTASKTKWGSRVIKYSAATEGNAQAHYSAPICVIGGTATFDAVDAKATTVFNAVKGKLGNEDYARFTLSPERVNIQKI